ncbi:VOC family protein [Gelidibacter mesophilus]|uniref:VOC family protein n=1 Tax=Gelidibacter mesophilus TaxID=169050 RepID=UPI0004279939|nr:VOC family protein [Gelidibacter mesophilus]
MATLNPYLTFNGNCEEAFNFYKSVFGGEFSHLGRFKVAPAESECQEMPKDQKNKIMHVSLPISKETVLMGSDGNPQFGEVTTGTHITLSIGTDSKEEADRLFNALSKDGKITMPMAEMFWGDYFGMLTDQYGFDWMIVTETVKQ